MCRRAHTDIINIANNGPELVPLAVALFHFFYTSKVQKMNQRERNALLAGGQLMLACQAKHEAAPVSSYDRENGQGEMHHEAGAHAARVNDFKVQCNT